MKENIRSSTSVKIAAALYRLAVAGWLGGAALFTFLLTPILFRSFSRDQAGAIVGVLFPGYFRWGLGCGVLALAALCVAKVERRRVTVALLLAMLVITSIQAFIVEPRAAALKREIPSFATTSPELPLRVQFRQLHGLSAVANLLVIGGGVGLVLLL